jgi:hypothetical protein
MADSPQTSSSSSGPRAASPAPAPATRTWRDVVSAEWTRFHSSLTRENLIAHAKTLAWVVPITLLIWIFAEREQVNTYKDQTVPFEIVNTDAGRVVSVRQDRNLLLELNGPRAAVDQVLEQLRGGRDPKGLQLELPAKLDLNRETNVPTLPMVRGQRVFLDKGITVISVQPPNLTVMADEVVERDAKLVLPPGRANIEATFNPPSVKLRGPLSIFQQAEAQQAGGELTVWADFGGDPLKQPGHYELPAPGLGEIVLRKPAMSPLKDDRVAIVPPPAKVRASIDVRQADKTWLVPSMPITIDATDGLLETYKVEWTRPQLPVLQNVTISGPPELIDAMKKPDFEPQAKARLVVTQQDVGTPRSKPVEYDLPDRVKVVDQDKNRAVEFRLVPWTTPPSQ